MLLSQCEVLAKNVNIGSEELQTALWFLHHGLGVLLYYPVDGLSNTVFCKVQAVYKSVTNLIKKTYIAQHVQHEPALDDFTKLGIFSLEEIENAPESSTSIPRHLLVQLLEHLNIITRSPSTLSPIGIENPYLMPCKLRCTREPISIPSEGSPEPLMLYFKCGFTPVGVFPAMITKLFSQAEKLDWKIVKEGPNFSRIYKNRVCFRVGKDIVYLISHLRYLEIVIQCSQHPFSEELLCHHVREVIEGALQKVTEKMSYDFLKGYNHAFWCTKCCGDKHPAILEKFTSPYVECLHNPMETENLNQRQRVWFSIASGGMYNG